MRRATARQLLQDGRIFRLFRRAGPWLREERVPLAGAVGCLLGAALMETARPWPIKIVIDGVLVKNAKKPRPLPFEFLHDLDSTTLLLGSCAALLAVALLGGVFAYGQAILAAKAGQRIQAGLRGLVFSHMQRLSPTYFQGRPLGDLLLRLMGDIPLLRDLLVTFPIESAAQLALFLGMVACMFVLDPVLTLVAVGILPVLGLLSGFFGRRIRDVSRKSRKKEGQVAATIQESLGAVTLVQAFARETYMEGILARRMARSLKAGVKAARLEARLSRGIEFVMAGGIALVLLLGTKRVLDGAITVGDLTIFLSYVRNLYKPLRDIAQQVSRLAKASASSERVLEILDEPVAVADRPGAKAPPPLLGRIEFEGVSFGYRPGRPVLHEVTAAIEPGRKVALVGHNGAGKSTIAGLVPRLYDPVSGRVSIDGTDLRDFRLEGLRDQIAIVFQEAVLFGASIRENIAFGRPDATEEEIVEAARRAGADGFVRLLPQGYDTLVGERGATLSGGERQRIALARMALRRSPIVILDEPTTALDPEAEARLRETLRALLEGKTAMIIAHRLGLLDLVDEVWVVERGRIVARGSHGELLANSPAYRAIVKAAAGGGAPREVPRAS